MPIVVLDPTSDSELSDRQLARPLEALAGRRVGLLDNRKANADRLFDLVEERLRTGHGVQAFVRRQKPDFSRTAPPDMLEDLRECDAVITGVGD